MGRAGRAGRGGAEVRLPLGALPLCRACQNDHGSSTLGFAATKTCLLAARSPSAISSSTCLGFECSSQATVRIFLVDEWATGRSGEAGGVGATGLGSGWATSGVRSSSAIAMVDPPPKTDLRFFVWTVEEAL